MSEPYGRTDMAGCGCVFDLEGFIKAPCQQHASGVIPAEDLADPEPWPWAEEFGERVHRCGPLSACARSGHVDRLPGEPLEEHRDGHKAEWAG